MKALIVYLTLTGRTKKVAELLAAAITTFEVDVESITFPKGRKEFHYIEENKKVIQGDLSSFNYDDRIFDLNPYDLICIGVPTWGGRPAFFFNAYVDNCNNFNGKAVVVFNTCRIFSGSTIKRMKSAIEERGGNIIAQKTFKALFGMGEKKAKAFGKILNEIELK